MNEKNLLVTTRGAIPSGFLPCRLTIGAASESPADSALGYREGDFGNLAPKAVDTLHVSPSSTKGENYYPPIAVCSNGEGSSLKFGTFVYRGVLYGTGTESEEELNLLFNEWLDKFGDTVDVYVENLALVNSGGGVDIFRFMLAILFGGLRHEPEKGTFTNEQNHCSNAYNRSWYKTQFLFKGFGIWFLYKQLGKSNSVIIKKLFTLLFLFRNSYRGFCSSIKLPCSTVRLHTNNSFRYTKKHYFDAQGTKLCCKRRVFYLGRRRQNHRPDYRSCVASNATSLKEVA